MRTRRSPPLHAAAVTLCASLLAASVAHAAPTLDDYKYFRSLSIDLQGRMPTRAEVADFERPDFKLDKWIDARLGSPTYADRLTRVYADLLHMQLRGFQYDNSKVSLARIQVLDPAGKPIYVYFRSNQKRTRDAKNAGFCLSEAETGLKLSGTYAPTGKALPVTQQVLDLYTTTVRPWWLFADYKSPKPQDRYDAQSWAQRFPGFVLNNAMLKEADGKTDAYDVRVCREEASTSPTALADGKQQMVSCTTGYGSSMSSSCGCGVGLEGCLPSSSYAPQFPGAMVNSSSNVMMGIDKPTDLYGVSSTEWTSIWMYQEPITFLKTLFAEDRDFREIVTGRYTYVNGPLAQFYKWVAPSNWRDYSFNYTEPTPLVDPNGMPPELAPQDVMTWKKVIDRGPNAAGILTMPVFLWKYATRRSRAHAVYNTFLCRDFVAPQGLQLAVTSEPNLMKRDGCAACHQTLEPLAAYFTRITESDWNWLDAKFYPAQNPACKTGQGGVCSSRYDPSFATSTYGMLRGAYGSMEHADAGPAGLGQYLVQKPEFARCVAENFATSFLNRDLRAEDDALRQQLVDALTSSGFRVKAMMKVLLGSDAYRYANNLTSSAWRSGGAK